jgi:hypothetical protein
MSRRFAFLPALVLLLVLAPGLAIPQTQAFVTLAELRNLVRPLLIFAPKPDDPQLEIQLRTLEEHARQAHDLSLLPIDVPYDAPTTTPAKFTDAEATSLRRRFQITPTEFTVILLDDQLAEIHRSSKPLSIQELDHLVKTTHRIVQ